MWVIHLLLVVWPLTFWSSYSAPICPHVPSKKTVFYLEDNRSTNDVPDDFDVLAAGYSNDRSSYVGNEMVKALASAGATFEYCWGTTSDCSALHCAPIKKEDGGDNIIPDCTRADSASTDKSVPRIIAILTGQCCDVAAHDTTVLCGDGKSSTCFTNVGSIAGVSLATSSGTKLGAHTTTGADSTNQLHVWGYGVSYSPSGTGFFENYEFGRFRNEAKYDPQEKLDTILIRSDRVSCDQYNPCVSEATCSSPDSIPVCTCPEDEYGNAYLGDGQSSCTAPEYCEPLIGDHSDPDNSSCVTEPRILNGTECTLSCQKGFLVGNVSSVTITCDTTQPNVMCEDIDECADDLSCLPSSTCVNTEGGYECTCPHFYLGDGQDIPCVAIPQGCPEGYVRSPPEETLWPCICSEDHTGCGWDEEGNEYLPAFIASAATSLRWWHSFVIVSAFLIPTNTM